MSGLSNTVKRIGNFSTGKGYATDEENRAKKKGKATAKKDKMFLDAELPDEEEIRLKARRKAARYRGSRAQTVLTDLDRLG